MKTRILLILTLALVVTSPAQENTRSEAHVGNLARVEAEYRENMARFGTNDDVLVMSGLLADRTTQRVLVRAEATGLGAESTVEFILTGPDSSHGYETLAMSFARPGDIHKALCFIGMTPGRSVAPARLQFWPKGERVILRFTSEVQPEAVRAERLMLDTRTGRPLENSGFVFTGSTGFQPGEYPGSEVYAANVRDPMSIAANYNEAESVLDVPRQAAQSEVYESQVVNPATLFEPGELLGIIMEPEYKDGRRRVIDLRLEAKPAPPGTNGVAAGTAGPAVYDLSETNRVIVRGASLPGLLKEFTTLTEAGRDPFVTVRFDDELTLGDIKRICPVLSAIDTATGIRVEAPLDGRLYYRAFLPSDSFRNREERIAQPWELRLKTGDGEVTGILTQVEQTWSPDKSLPELTLHHFETPTPASLRQELKEQGPGLPVILVFAEPGIRYGQLLAFIAPVLPTHGTVYVFTE